MWIEVVHLRFIYFLINEFKLGVIIFGLIWFL
jgi:hypothetical protein